MKKMERFLLLVLTIVLIGCFFAGLVIVGNNVILGAVMILAPLGVVFVLTEMGEDDR